MLLVFKSAEVFIWHNHFFHQNIVKKKFKMGKHLLHVLDFHNQELWNRKLIKNNINKLKKLTVAMFIKTNLLPSMNE